MDYSGRAVETVWDIISFLISLVDVCINPTDFFAWLGLGMDAISVFVPFLPALGASTKIDDLYDIARWLGKSDDFTDTAKLLEVAHDAENLVDTTKDTVKVSNSVRQSAVTAAWKNEYLDVKNGGSGISRVWSQDEITELLSIGKVKGYQGHHMKSVKGYPSLAGDPTNIQFLTRSEHLKAHNGNWRNITHGRFINLGG